VVKNTWGYAAENELNPTSEIANLKRLLGSLPASVLAALIVITVLYVFATKFTKARFYWKVACSPGF
jgi:hypothetical protein